MSQNIERTLIEGARIQFLGDVPKIVRDEVLAFWPEIAAFVPRWIRELGFRYNGSDEDGESCSVSPNDTYKWATIYLTGNWLDDDRELMRQNLIHEIAHLYVQPVAAFAKETFETLVKADSPKLHEVLTRELTHRIEQSVQEFAWALSGTLERESLKIGKVEERHGDT